MITLRWYSVLVLTIREGQAVHIGDDIIITAMRARGGEVQIGFDAPKSVVILRGKVANRERRKQREQEKDRG